jgi:hypothetical protein
MKSIKPGRGPSALGAAGSIGTIIFGVFWTILAFSLTRSVPFPLVGIIFPLFGLIFIGMGIANAVFHYKNATGDNRMSLFDITDNNEEPDPFDAKFSKKTGSNSSSSISGTNEKSNKNGVRQFDGDFCPFCGNKVQQDFDFCPKCGKDI